jgi:uncharacterized heparinase superfamily protein
LSGEEQELATMNLGQLLRTTRRLDWSQLVWRARYSLERRRKLSRRAAVRGRWLQNESPRLRSNFPAIPLFHRLGPPLPEVVLLLRNGVFYHLNQGRHLGSQRPNWPCGPVAAERLWTVTLHYHGWAYDLAERAAAGNAESEDAARLIRHYLSDWIERCALYRAGARHLAWNSYAIATRLTWWIRAYQVLEPTGIQVTDPFWQEFLGSLWQQAAYLHDHLEWDVRANHLLRDAVGLAWAGRFFAEPSAVTWLAEATRIAGEQVLDQVLPDGGHFERSPTYHLHVMEDLLTLYLLVQDRDVQELLRLQWRRMGEYLAWIRHPDGGPAAFNDGGLHSACSPGRMLELGRLLGVDVDVGRRQGTRHFPHAGMVICHGDPWSVFFDVGEVGPDCQPGHAHADTLAVECSFRGRRLFVDPGTYAYDNDARRQYDRSTGAHNTLCIDGQDSSEVWHIFRVGRRAFPREVYFAADEHGLRARAAHDGYDHLPGRPRHRREIIVRGANLAITDRVESGGSHRVEGGFLLAPTWKATPDAGGWVLQAGTDRVRVTTHGPQGLKCAEQRRPYHPDYGREVETTRLSWHYNGALPVQVTTQVAGA